MIQLYSTWRILATVRSVLQHDQFESNAKKNPRRTCLVCFISSYFELRRVLVISTIFLEKSDILLLKRNAGCVPGSGRFSFFTHLQRCDSVESLMLTHIRGSLDQTNQNNGQIQPRWFDVLKCTHQKLQLLTFWTKMLTSASGLIVHHFVEPIAVFY